MHRKSLFIIFSVVFVDLIGFGMVIPILPYYAKSFGASATTLGLLMMSYSGMQFVFSPFWGQLSDRFGRRSVILTSILGIGLSMIILGYAQSLTWLFAGRLLAGFFGANISAASAYIADITPPEKRAKGMGLIGVAFGLGFLFGPALGGFLSQWGYGTAALVAAILAFVNFIFAVLELKEPQLSEEIRRGHRHPLDQQRWRETLTHPKVGLPILLFFLVTFGFAQLETTFALFILARFGLGAKSAGYILALMAIIMILIQGGAIGKMAKVWGETKIVILGTSLMALSLLAASLAVNLKLFIAFLMMQAMGYAMTNPSLLSLTSRNTPENIQGTVLGIYQSAGSLARVLGPLSAGILFDHLGIRVPFWSAAALFAISFLICGGSKTLRKKDLGKTDSTLLSKTPQMSSP